MAVHHGSIKQDEGFAIGVAVADHPSGPWKDALGHALITDLTENDVKLNIDPAIFYDGDGKIQPIKRTSGVDKVNNALIKNGAYRLTVSHSNLALQDDGNMVVQQVADEAADNQLWVVAQGKTKRHYTLQNYGTKKYYCPQAVLLDTVRTSAMPCEIRIENASEKLGYFLFANYDDDYLGDVLNISKEPGMPVITWVRTGTDNQKVRFDAVALPEPPVSSSSSAILSSSSYDISSSSGTASIVSSEKIGMSRLLSFSRNAGIRFSEPVDYMVLDVQGNVIRKGFGAEIPASFVNSGVYLLKFNGKIQKIRL